MKVFLYILSLIAAGFMSVILWRLKRRAKKVQYHESVSGLINWLRENGFVAKQLVTDAPEYVFKTLMYNPHKDTVYVETKTYSTTISVADFVCYHILNPDNGIANLYFYNFSYDNLDVTSLLETLIADQKLIKSRVNNVDDTLEVLLMIRKYNKKKTQIANHFLNFINSQNHV
jgi:hypothetical protein